MTRQKRISHPLEVVSVGDIVDVRVIDVEISKARIGLSMILDEKEAEKKVYDRGAAGNANGKDGKRQAGVQGQKPNSNEKKADRNRRPKKEGLNMNGLAKFMR